MNVCETAKPSNPMRIMRNTGFDGSQASDRLLCVMRSLAKLMRNRMRITAPRKFRIMRITITAGQRFRIMRIRFRGFAPC